MPIALVLSKVREAISIGIVGFNVELNEVGLRLTVSSLTASEHLLDDVTCALLSCSEERQTSCGRH